MCVITDYFEILFIIVLQLSNHKNKYFNNKSLNVGGNRISHSRGPQLAMSTVPVCNKAYEICRCYLSIINLNFYGVLKNYIIIKLEVFDCHTHLYPFDAIININLCLHDNYLLRFQTCWSKKWNRINLNSVSRRLTKHNKFKLFELIRRNCCGYPFGIYCIL